MLTKGDILNYFSRKELLKFITMASAIAGTDVMIADEALAAEVRPENQPIKEGMVDFTEYRFEKLIPVSDRPTDDPKTWKWEKAVNAALDYSKSQAVTQIPLGDGKTRIVGLPHLKAPQGEYWMPQIVAEFWDGWGLWGTDEMGTVYKTDFNGELIKNHRSARLRGGYFQHKGTFKPNQKFMYITENSSDPKKNGVAFDINFRNVRLTDLHMGVHWVGNEMGDQVHLENFSTDDVFRPLFLNNDQAVDLSWTRGAVKFGTKGNRNYDTFFSDPGWSNVFVQGSPPDKFDANAICARKGGNIRVEGVSFIHMGTSLFLMEPRSDADSANIINPSYYTFSSCTWENRWDDPASDGWGQDRCTVVRTDNPFPSVRTGIQAKIIFDGGTRFNTLYPSGSPSVKDLFHVSNGIEIIFRDGRVLGSNYARIIELISSFTKSQKGYYSNDKAPQLNVQIKRNGQPDLTVRHKIVQENFYT